jgi:ketosteroid isomerase-like protein
MSEPRLEVARRAVDAFNRWDGDAMRELSVAEPEIVPLRAALENTSYSGPGAIDEFMSDSEQSWSTIRIDPDRMREVGACVLCTGTLHATARESGAPVETPITWVWRFAGDRIATFRTFPDEAAALAAIEET